MGRAFQKNVRHRCRRTLPTCRRDFTHKRIYFSETALEPRLRRCGESPALRRDCAPAVRPQPFPRCEAAWPRAVQQSSGSRDAGCPVRTREPDLRRECEAAEQKPNTRKGLVERCVGVAKGGRLREAEPGHGGEESGQRAGNVATFIWVSEYIRYMSVPGPTAMHSRSPGPRAELRIN